MNLQLAGWNESWAQHFLEFSCKGLKPARVMAQHRHSYSLWAESGEAEAEIAGALLYRASGDELPVVGDWVAIRQYSQGDLAIMTDVLPRKTKFSRKASGATAEEQVIAANIDLLLIVCGLDHDYNLRRLERYLVATGQSGAEPVIVLNKADLCVEVDSHISQVQAIAPEARVVSITATAPGVSEQLLPVITAGKTAALVGSSGAGKSTIVNQLLGMALQPTQPTRESDGRGRHTTTHRELFFLPNGGLILDNPGIRELQLWSDHGMEGVDHAFPEIDAIAEQCAFRDCSHNSEPDCAVQAALASGEIDESRWGSYLKLRRELRHAATLVDENFRREEKERWKKLCSAIKRNQKRK